MDSQQIEAMQLITKSETQFYIPVYQRKYSWGIEQCSILYRDIKRLNDNREIEHFLGTVIYKKDNLAVSKVTVLEIIDSQQRLTTLSIFLKALSEYAISFYGLKDNPITDKVYTFCLINKYVDTISKTKLQLTQSDAVVYDNLINDDIKLQDYGHPIIVNYNYFLNRLRADEVNPDEIYQAMKRLIMIELALGENDNAQATFESVNSTGLRMQPADYIRNYIFIGLPTQMQNQIYYSYWDKIENLFNNESVMLTVFLRNYLLIKTKDWIKEGDTYEVFKREFAKDDIRIMSKELSIILDYAKVYKNIINVEHPDKDIEKKLKEFSDIGVKPFHIVLMKLLLDYEYKKIDKNILMECLQISINYIVRRYFVDLPTNQYNKLTIGLINNIREKNYFHSFQNYLLTRESVARFPDDEEFEVSFIHNPIYGKNKYLRNYVIYQLENYKQNEKMNIENSELTIEHILPQNKNLNMQWKKDLGSNWKEVQDKYLHTIGNLTLTGYNSKMQDKSFLEKRDMKKGFRDCPARLNDTLRDLTIWNEEEILKRAKSLFNMAIDIWKYPKINKMDTSVDAPLTINDNWINKNLTKIAYRDKEKYVTNTTQAYKFIIECMYEENPNMFMNLIQGHNFGGKSFASYKPNNQDKEAGFELFNTGLYISTKFNSKRKKENIIRLMNILSIKEDEIEIWEE